MFVVCDLEFRICFVFRYLVFELRWRCGGFEISVLGAYL